MNRAGNIVLTATALLLASCASFDELVNTPEVSLRDVQVEDINLSGQTFLLSFDVTNPNPFPLPISTVSYGINLDGHRFASGETQSAFTVPARSDAAFAISVDLNLLKTAPELLFIVRDATREDISYTLEGRLGLDIPAFKPVEFRTEGRIRLQTALN